MKRNGKEGTVKKREPKKIPGGQPKKKAWAGRFRQATAPEVERFTESISFDQRLYRQDILGSIAHARMLAHQGILPAGDAKRIEKGLREIAGEIQAGRFRFSSKLEDIHMNIESELTRRIGAAGTPPTGTAFYSLHLYQSLH